MIVRTRTTLTSPAARKRSVQRSTKAKRVYAALQSTRRNYRVGWHWPWSTERWKVTMESSGMTSLNFAIWLCIAENLCWWCHRKRIDYGFLHFTIGVGTRGATMCWLSIYNSVTCLTRRCRSKLVFIIGTIAKLFLTHILLSGGTFSMAGINLFYGFTFADFSFLQRLHTTSIDEVEHRLLKSD